MSAITQAPRQQLNIIWPLLPEGFILPDEPVEHHNLLSPHT